ncbi:MAG TPA: glycogen debranching N-terminal domain-containing protein [Candidatus Limnocylindrales bacterium]|nr:glycogen debranching N-terminal domain-containing protein [Candidatus Limnocylindrales bacterium]
MDEDLLTRVIAYSGYTVLCSAADGSIGDGQEGLWDHDCRILSRHRLSIADTRPTVVSSGQPSADRWEAVLRVARTGGSDAGPQLPQDALEIDVRRWIGPVLHETIRVQNHSAVGCQTTLLLEFDADFRDRLAEYDGDPPSRVERGWDEALTTLRFDYRAEHEGRTAIRGVRVGVVLATSPPKPVDAGFEFGIALEPNGEWSAQLEYASVVGSDVRTPDAAEHDRRSRQRARWAAGRLRIDADERLAAPFARAADDLFDLRNFELERRWTSNDDGAAWVVNAGMPMFTGFFGRDALTVGWQSAMLGPRATLGALAVAAATQATADDPWRDAEPGKMIHEMRRGPLTEIGLSPRDAYYGTQTTPAMFVIALSEAWHWTGDTTLLRRYRDAALRAFEWAETFGDLDTDGFLEYRQRSPKGLKNHGWKDSNEAVRYPDGRLVANPIATVEEQAFHYVALVRMAEILVALGEDEAADRFEARAARLRERWHEAFWMPDEGFYALALDADKRQVRSIASNAGHALGAGIVPPEQARVVADRLLEGDLFSGWGVRSLSNRHPSFNPFAYHLGAVWPVEQATFVLGFKRYGLDDHVERLVAAVLDAAVAFPDARLPEALSGHDRAEFTGPVRYPTANSPQAWSASAVVQVVQIMLGLYPFAPLHLLALVRPRLPEWLPAVTVRNLRVGRATVDLRFERRPDGSAAHRVLRRRGSILIVPAGPPQDVGGSTRTGEEALRFGLRVAPGRLARAARLGIGLV